LIKNAYITIYHPFVTKKSTTHHKTSSTYVLENKQYEIAFAN